MAAGGGDNFDDEDEGFSDDDNEVLDAGESEREGSEGDPEDMTKGSMQSSAYSLDNQGTCSASAMHSGFTDNSDRNHDWKLHVKFGKKRAALATELSKRYKEDSLIADFALSSVFEYTTLLVISINAIWMGVESDLNNAGSISDTDTVWIVGENLFCVYFLLEVLIRYAAFKNNRLCLQDYWFVFDSALVILMVFETWAIYAVEGPDLGFLRLLRLARLSRLARLMHQVPEFLIMVKGIFTATRSVGSVLLLLVVLCYVFAIVFTGNYKAEPGKEYTEAEIELQGYFGTLPMSMFTLFCNGTMLDDLADLVKAIREDSIMMLVALFIFILIAAFTVLNMLIGILCDVVSSTERKEKQRRKVEEVRDVLSTVFEGIDKDGSGKVSNKEFEVLCEDEQVLVLLENKLGIDRSQLEQLKALLFTTSEKRQKELSFEDFLKHLIRMRPQELASPMDVQQFRKVLREQERTVMKSLSNLRDKTEAASEMAMADRRERRRSARESSQSEDRRRSQENQERACPQTAVADLEVAAVQRQAERGERSQETVEPVYQSAEPVAPGEQSWAEARTSPRSTPQASASAAAAAPSDQNLGRAYYAKLVAEATDSELVEEIRRRSLPSRHGLEEVVEVS